MNTNPRHRNSRLIFRTAFIIMITMICICGCIEEESLWDMPLVETRHAIIGGIPADDETYGAVVAIVYGNEKRITLCSGTLITPDTVLTAAHCLEDLDNGKIKFRDLCRDGKMHVVTGSDIHRAAPSDFFGIKDYVLHDKFNPAISAHDVGLIRLDRPVPRETASPIPVVPSDTGLTSLIQDGSKITLAGFGYDAGKKDGIRLCTSLTISSYCPPDAYSCHIRRGDSPNKIVLPGGSFAYFYDGSGQCTGDSGGPALIKTENGMKVIGVCSFGDEDCSHFGVNIHAGDEKNWIDKELSERADKSGDSCSAQPRRISTPFEVLPVLFIFLSGILISLKFLEHDGRSCRRGG